MDAAPHAPLCEKRPAERRRLRAGAESTTFLLERFSSIARPDSTTARLSKIHFFTFILTDAEWQRVRSAADHWDDYELSRAELLRRCLLSGAYVISHLPQAKQKALGEHFRSQLDFAPDWGFNLRLQGERNHHSQAAGSPDEALPKARHG